tara:strand:- start:2665 stop:3015 length:351 start_codon:yes stop_codon:yes gene_type:complete
MDPEDKITGITFSNCIADAKNHGSPTATYSVSIAGEHDDSEPLTIEPSYTSGAGPTFTFDNTYNGIGGGVQEWPTEMRINEMILRYPALKIAHENFLKVYNLVKEDFGNGDDDVPF